MTKEEIIKLTLSYVKENKIFLRYYDYPNESNYNYNDDNEKEFTNIFLETDHHRFFLSNEFYISFDELGEYLEKHFSNLTELENFLKYVK